MRSGSKSEIIIIIFIETLAFRGLPVLHDEFCQRFQNQRLEKYTFHPHSGDCTIPCWQGLCVSPGLATLSELCGLCQGQFSLLKVNQHLDFPLPPSQETVQYLKLYEYWTEHSEKWCYPGHGISSGFLGWGSKDLPNSSLPFTTFSLECLLQHCLGDCILPRHHVSFFQSMNVLTL